MIGVVGARSAKCACSADHRIAQRIARRVHGDLERATNAPPLALAQLVVFQGNELPAHVLPTPTCAALGFPVVVVGGCTSHIDHAVNRAGTANCLALYPLLVAHALAALGLVAPHMGVAGVEQLANATGHGDQWAGVIRATLDQQY
ncbi:hypothetical protein D3C78_1497400 [compost metagenome]